MILDDVITLATDDATRTSALLRKCLVLAHLLKNERLKAWVQHELNGYEGDVEIPSYRQTVAAAKGNFVGPFNTSWNGWPIPPSVLEKDHRHWAETLVLTQAIAAYEDILHKKDTDQGQWMIPWPSPLASYYQQRIRNNKGMVLVNAWQEIPKSVVIELIDSVRNRILSLALELKDEVGADEKKLNEVSSHSAEMVENKVVQQIFSGTVYMASGHASIQVQSATLVPGEWGQLSKALEAAGIASSSVEELSDAIQVDNSKMGDKVLSWVKKQAANVISGGVKMGASAGQAVLTEYLKQHFGLR